MIKKSLVLFLLWPMVLWGAAEQKTWSINNDHSELSFKVEYLSISSITGRFDEYWGQIRFDDDGVLPNKITFHMEANSINTGSQLRDGHLKSNDFFASKKFPTITFKSEKIEALEPGWFLVHGNLKIKDKIKKESLRMKISEAVDDTWGYTSKFISFSTSIDRKKYQLDWNKGLKGNELLVGNIVEVTGRFQIQPVNRKTPPSKHMIPNTNFSKLRDKLNTGKITQEEFNAKVLTVNSKTRNDVEKKEGTGALVETILSNDPSSDFIKQLAYMTMRFIGLAALWMGIIFIRKKIQKDAIFGFIISLFTLIYLWAFWFVQIDQ